MPPRLTYPGVYVEEQSSGVKTITGVATSTTLFVGMSRRGPVGRPTPIRGIDQFEQTFGDDVAYGELVTQVRQFFLNGGADAIVMRIGDDALLPAAVTLTNLNAVNVLRLTARSPGRAGGEIRATVDYDTPSPEMTFNIEIYRRSVDLNGRVTISENEFFGDLSMNPASPRYAVTLLSDTSALVTAALPGAALGANGRGLSRSALYLPNDDAGASAAINGLLPANAQIRLSLNGGAAITVAIPLVVGNDLTAWQDAIANNVDTALTSAGQPGGVTVDLDDTNGTHRAIRFRATNPDAESVEIFSAGVGDASGPLQLGAGAGGIEISRHSRHRPAPNGYTTALHDHASNTFNDTSNLARLFTFAALARGDLDTWSFDPGTGLAAIVPNPPSAPGFSGPGATLFEGNANADGDGSLLNTAQHLDTLVSHIQVGLGADWTVRRTGYRINITPNTGDANTGALATLTSAVAAGYDIGDGAGIADPALAANAQAFALGSSGAGSFQTNGTPGTDGGVPNLDHYNAIFSTVASEVDIFNILVLPRGHEQDDDARASLWGSASAFCQRERAFLIVDPRSDWGNVDEVAGGIVALRTGTVTDHAAIYWPRLNVVAATIPIDPGGTMAGIMARTDTRRGVWKAPAGLETSIIGARGLEHPISDAENGVTNPQAVNTLRQFSTGIVSWGARNMAGFDNSGENDYKYVPVRRTALFIEESLYRGLQFALFEPNDEPLWAQIRLAAGAFMQNLFRQGAFQGAKASDAYDVRCDATTTTQNDINLGRVNVIVAFAPLRPAEFVVLTVRQLAGQVQV